MDNNNVNENKVNGKKYFWGKLDQPEIDMLEKLRKMYVPYEDVKVGRNQILRMVLRDVNVLVDSGKWKELVEGLRGGTI